MVPRRRPLIRQKRRQCSRMGSTSQGERGVVSGTATVAVESKQRGDGGAVPAAIKNAAPPRNGDFTAENHLGRC